MSAVVSHGRPGKTQAVPFTGSSAAAAAVGTQTYRVRLVATAACLITISNDDEAGMYIAPNFPEVFLVTPGQVLNVVEAVASGTGTLYLTELE